MDETRIITRKGVAKIHQEARTQGMSQTEKQTKTQTNAARRSQLITATTTSRTTWSSFGTRC